MARLSSFYREAIGHTQYGFEYGRGLLAGRKLSVSLFWISTILLFSQSGCSVWDLARRTMRDEPDCYDVRPEEEEDLERYRCWAVEAWQSAGGSLGSGAFYEGFLDGFVDHVYSGGNGEPPVIPPCQFWTNKNVDASASITEWNAGFRRGAAAASEGGYRDRVVVPVSINSGRPQRPNVSGQCVANEPDRNSDHETDYSPWDMSSTESDPVEFMEAPETGYELPNTVDAQGTSEAPGELPASEAQAESYLDSTPWPEPESQTIELDPDEQVESDGPTLGNPNGSYGPPEAPEKPTSADELFDSLSPENMDAPPTTPGGSEPIDLDDLFSASPIQQQSPPRAENDKAVTERGPIPAYKDWSYGDIVAASQSEQTSSMPVVANSQAQWAGQTSRPKNDTKPQSSSSVDTVIEFSQNSKEYQGSSRSSRNVRQATNTAPVPPEEAPTKPLRNWRISDWQKKFQNGDQTTDVGEREGVSFDAWKKAYGKKK